MLKDKHAGAGLLGQRDCRSNEGQQIYDRPDCGKVTIRGRDTGYPVPPAQTRTCGFPASGSSVVLAFARIFTVTRYKTQLLFPAGRLACLDPIRQCPGQVSFAGYVLPSGPSPMYVAFPRSEYYA